MRLQIIYKNKIQIEAKNGFLVFEAIISFTISTLFITTIVALIFSMDRLKDSLIKQIELIPEYIQEIEKIKYGNPETIDASIKSKLYGNYSSIYNIGPLSLSISDYYSALGQESCRPVIKFDKDNVSIYSNGVFIGDTNMSTDMKVRNGYIYMTADSSISTMPDLYIMDARDPLNIRIISSLNTGPGLVSLAVASHYIYALNAGTTNTLQIFDIENREMPLLITKFKLPTPNASTTPPIPTSIFYSKNKVYIGTEKWIGNEFNIIDVSNPNLPIVTGGYNIDSEVEHIFVKDNVAYVANASEKQLIKLDVKDSTNINIISYISPSGYATQEGKITTIFEDNLLFGRTVGGFNVTSNHEFFGFSTTSLLSTQALSINLSKDILGGIYGLIYRDPYIYIATGQIDHEFQVWDKTLTNKIYDKSLGFFPRNMTCDNYSLYITTHNNRGVYIINLKNK